MIGLFLSAVVMGVGCSGAPDEGLGAAGGVGRESAMLVPLELSTTVTITPASPDTTHDLTASESDSVGGVATWRWYKDGVLQPHLTTPTVPAAETSRGDRWSVFVEVVGSGAIWRGGSPVMVGDAPPSMPEAMVDPPDPHALVSPLTCVLATPAVDPDGDPVTYSVAWSVDGEAYDGPRRSVVLPGDTIGRGLPQEGELWTCEVTAHSRALVERGIDGAVTVLPFEPVAVDPVVPADVSVTPADAAPGETVTIRYRGALVDAPSLDLLVGFNGWRLEVDGAETSLSPEGLVNRFLRVPMTRVGSFWQATVTWPEEADAAHMTFDSPSDCVVDDNGGLEYHHGIVFPYIGPFLTWTDATDPSTGIVVTWESDATSHGIVTYGVWPDLQYVALGDTVDNLHHVLLDDLQPDTTYAYQVHDGTGRSSEVYTFTTPPVGVDRYRFLAMADMQDQGMEDDRWPEVANAALAEVPDASFVIVAGDMAGDDRPGLWWRYFHGGRDLFARVPMLPVVGNHDTPGTESNPDTTSYRRYFEVPTAASGTEDYYAFTFGNMRFVAISTEDEASIRSGGIQEAWVESELFATIDGGAPLCDWVFTAMHHPPYDAGARFASQAKKYRQITSHFDGFVDWTFAAHEHLAQRFLPVDYSAAVAPSGLYGPTGDDGSGYLVLPAAGCRPFADLVLAGTREGDNREVLAFPDVPAGDTVAPSEHGFVSVEIDGRSIAVRTWGMGTWEIPAPLAVVDEVVYTKP